MNPSSQGAASRGGSGGSEGTADGNDGFELDFPAAMPSADPGEAAPTPTPTADPAQSQLYQRIQTLISANHLSAYVSVHSEERGIVVTLVEGLLFPSGSADINDDAAAKLADLAAVIKSVDNYIRIEGSTDNVPISSSQYTSNMALAFYRANNVRDLFLNQGVDRSRMSVTSYGEDRPVAPNDTEENKRLNRRVDIVFLDASLNASEPEAAGKSN
jgi:chemotaxis protein MotB